MQAGGEKAGAKLRFTMEDVDLLSTNVPQITRMTPDVGKDASIQYDTRTFNFNVSGCYPTVSTSGFSISRKAFLTISKIRCSVLVSP